VTNQEKRNCEEKKAFFSSKGGKEKKIIKRGSHRQSVSLKKGKRGLRKRIKASEEARVLSYTTLKSEGEEGGKYERGRGFCLRRNREKRERVTRTHKSIPYVPTNKRK